MKLMLGGTPVKKMMIHNDTMDATMVASDMQAGVTAYANGQKITGTGKSFSFAMYGSMFTNEPVIIPSTINIIEIASTSYPIQLKIELSKMKNVDFSTIQSAATVVVNGTQYDIAVNVVNGELNISCDQTIKIQVFYGKDEYV